MTLKKFLGKLPIFISTVSFQSSTSETAGVTEWKDCNLLPNHWLVSKGPLTISFPLDQEVELNGEGIIVENLGGNSYKLDFYSLQSFDCNKIIPINWKKYDIERIS